MILTLLISTISAFQIGLGVHDVTGPVGGVNMMGYAMPEQVTQGIKQRLRARAFVFQNNDKAVVYVSVDTALISQNMKRHVIERLADDRFGQENILLSATHTHSSVAGYNDYLLYGITSLGYVKESEDDLVDGIVGAIRRALKSVKPSELSIATGKLLGANINRSPLSYLANSQAQRDKFEDGDTDKTMTTLKVTSEDGVDRGMVAFFSVHGTSMNNSIRLVSGDNKGYASWLMEKEMNYNEDYQPYLSQDVHRRVDDGEYFVAAFGQTQEGDVSPNIKGAFCIDTGAPCDLLHSTCPDKQGRPRNAMCQARGPGNNSEESTRIIGLRQYLKARQLYQEASAIQDHTVDYAHAWIDMSNVTVRLEDSSEIKTCKAARGYSFASGTTDGPGMFDFIQGDNSTGKPFWNFIKQFIGAKASDEQVACQLPKPILLNTGEATKPYPWEAAVLDIQIFRVGSLVLLAVPAEFTTMAGRMLKETVADIFVESGTIARSDIHVVIAGLSNSYSGYVTTFAEYQIQRYEGASTIYGPNTLSAYIQEFKRLAYQMTGQKIDNLPKVGHNPLVAAPDFTAKLLTFLTPVVFDSVPLFRKFGQVKVDVSQSLYRIGEVVSATFYSGHPRNIAQNTKWQLEQSFVSVEKYIGQFSLDQVETQFASSFQLVSSTDTKVLTYKRQLALQIQGDVPFEEFLYVYQVDGVMRSSREYPQVDSDNLWRLVRDDDDWDLTFHWWKDVAALSSESYARVDWKISRRPDMDVIQTLQVNGVNKMVQPPLVGQFRLKYNGAHKNILGQISRHEGVSSVFTVVE